MAKEIDRQRTSSALAVVRQHPVMVLFALSPVLVGLGLVWWLLGAGWAIALFLLLAVVGGVVVLRQR
ncbi:hypothetical protein CRI77_20240 [Mycolicibacterium duvalii]|uniref:Uncharacterized protein n=1 Tax=Mycolicibacterium duvalii TaxID=39688 RepID=A0A7I7JVT1_9MYCO|nr:hypothetical protein [Mycolicibacterium duvalii]MCV7369225.1 hypothetical protein [Mycolicibacterium duvalii]PEG37706.1 hypothetical protein CRI77_20240 [Mycolicibacterium duvalii]BBX15409.1 hypothetical protein MDUV_02690 [Mycolicibacterium duvalii]